MNPVTTPTWDSVFALVAVYKNKILKDCTTITLFLKCTSLKKYLEKNISLKLQTLQNEE